MKRAKLQFDQDTLDAAQNDTQLLVKEKMRLRAAYVGKLESAFEAGFLFWGLLPS